MGVHDANTERGVQTFLYSHGNRIILFMIGAWPGLVVGLWPFWRQAPGASFGRFGYAFGWALLVSIIGAMVYQRIRHNRINRSVAQADAAATVERELAAVAAAEAPKPSPFEVPFMGLTLGWSTAKLFSRDHPGGVPNQPEGQTEVWLRPEDASKNLIIFGGIGSGKTTRAINPLLLQILQQDTGALIFDIKTDFENEVRHISAMAGREYKVVGDGGMTLNLLRGCTPELASSFLKSCYLAQGQGSGDSAFWIDSATEMTRHCLHLLRLGGGDYSIAGLYDIVFNEPMRDQMLADCAANAANLSDRDQRFLLQTQMFIVNQWNRRDEKLKTNMEATMSQVLSPFTHPDLADAFSAGSVHGEADMTALINDGDVFLVKLPMTKYGMAGARFAYMILKLRFMNMMRERRTRTEWNQDRPVAFICDEYQAIIDPISDTDFWDKSRSTKTVGMVSMQGISSLVHALGGNHQTANAILQNFRQRLIFRTEDEATTEHARKVLGQIDVVQEGASDSQGVSFNFGPQTAGSKSHSESQSAGVNRSLSRHDLFSAADMRNLSADECLFIGNVGDYNVDEVLNVKPLYVPPPGSAQQSHSAAQARSTVA